jgi:hypothetical protein
LVASQLRAAAPETISSFLFLSPLRRGRASRPDLLRSYQCPDTNFLNNKGNKIMKRKVLALLVCALMGFAVYFAWAASQGSVVAGHYCQTNASGGTLSAYVGNGQGTGTIIQWSSGSRSGTSIGSVPGGSTLATGISSGAGCWVYYSIYKNGTYLGSTSHSLTMP